MDNKEELSFEELYNQSLEKETKLEKTVTGKIISISRDGEIYVDFGYKADGIIPKEEYSFDQNANPNDEFKVGDEITAEVLKQNDGLGNVLLSYKRYKARNDKKCFEEKINNDEVFTAKISTVMEKGFIVNIFSTRVFIPLSQSGIKRDENIDDYKDKEVSFKIIEYNPQNRRIIGSIKILLDEEKKKKEDEFWNDVEIGKTYKGIVTSICSYGAFVDLGVVQGLLHITEMSWAKNVDPNTILKVGQEINVVVKNVDKEHKRLLLVYGEKGPNPWENIEEKYKVNDIVKAKVVKIVPFGAFLEIEEGIEGLVHISQICEKKITKPEEELTVGKYVNAKIINIDKENKKMELSIRELEGTSNEYKEV